MSSKATLVAQVFGRQILDSRGNPTVEAEVTLRSGASGRAAVPSGVSTGSREAVELRDGGQRWGGMGVMRAVEHLNGPLGAALRGVDALDQYAVDDVLLEATRLALARTRSWECHSLPPRPQRPLRGSRCGSGSRRDELPLCRCH
jgi:hypothetical protein